MAAARSRRGRLAGWLAAAVAAAAVGVCAGAVSSWAEEEASADPSCSATSARLVLTSERNETGDWVARVRLVHDAEPSSWEQWRVEAEHTVLRCAGAETRVLVEANVTIPRSAARPAGAAAVPGRRGQSSGEGSGSGGGAVGVLGSAPEGFTAVARLRSAYRFHDEWVMWADARAACEAAGAHLAVPSSEDEYNALAKLSSKHPWIGLFYDKELGRYMTVKDEPVDDLSYVRWGAGEPDKSGDCIFFQTLTKTLYDEPCGFVEVFICETPLDQDQDRDRVNDPEGPPEARHLVDAR